MNNLSIGDYVTVTNKLLSTRNQRGLIVGTEQNKFIVLFSSNKKQAYRGESLTRVKHNQVPCVIVTFNYAEYLVTPLDTIVSMKTHRIMKWSDDHPNTKGILSIAYNLKKDNAL